MTAQELVSEGMSWLGAKYPDYASKPARERRVLAAAWLCDKVKPREKTGNNDGELVEAIQKTGGGKKGDKWCAFAQTAVAKVARVWFPPSGPGAVLNWLNLGRNAGKAIPVKSVQRGDLLIRVGSGRHIGIAVRPLTVKGIGLIWGIEGNTGPGEEGPQNDGQGMYRRLRKASFWTHAIKGD